MLTGTRSDRTQTSWNRDAARPLEADQGVLPFDRRREPRRRTEGWAQILCNNPYRTFLGGTKELVDISSRGVGLRSDCPLPVGEIVEVRFAPFRVRGKVGRVVRCEPVDDDHGEGDDRANGGRVLVAVEDDPTSKESAESSTNAARRTKPRRYTIGITFNTRRAAA